MTPPNSAFDPCLPNLSVHENHEELSPEFVKTQMTGPSPRVSHSLGLELGSKLCVSNKFQIKLIL